MKAIIAYLTLLTEKMSVVRKNPIGSRMSLKDQPLSKFGVS
jgi:hypothetical protein